MSTALEFIMKAYHWTITEKNSIYTYCEHFKQLFYTKSVGVRVKKIHIYIFFTNVDNHLKMKQLQ